MELIDSGYDVIIVDNLSNSSKDVVARIEEISGNEAIFYELDLRDEVGLREVFRSNDIEAVIHFAGLKAVGESAEKPIEYYDNNLNSTISLFKVMREFKCKKLVFSSSATVYDSKNDMPLSEDKAVGNCTNPYGWTKYMIEQILRDASKADDELQVTLLRYFNPIGAHSSALIGENPNGIPNNLMPYITQVAVGKRKHLNVFGNDYDTHDGTGVRDYIHVVDLSKGHVAALRNMKRGISVYNLGTGQGYSALDVVNAFIGANGVDVPYVIAGRRQGDIDVCYSNPAKALEELGWKAALNLADMCRDSWEFEKKFNEL